MTMEQMRHLKVALEEYRDWLAQDVPDTLEQLTIEAVLAWLAFDMARLAHELSR